MAGYTSNSLHGKADVLIPIAAVRKDAAAALAQNDGGYGALQLDASGNLRCSISTDIQLGAVEIKDGTTDTRAVVGANGLAVYLPGGATFAPTFTRVKIVTVADTPLALKAALASNYTRLHALFGTINVAGTVTIEDSDGTDLSGPMSMAATGGVVIPFTADPNGCPISAVGKGLSLLTTQIFNGWAVVSQATT